MKNNNLLYGAIIALVVIVAALGYNQYANKSGAPTDTVVATDEMTAVVGTDEEAAENPDPAAIATTAAIDATAEAQQAEAQADATAVAPAATTDTAATTETPAADVVTPAPVAPATETAAPAATGDESLLAAPTALQMNVAEMMADRMLGDAGAPVTIVEYASYTCSHCAQFHNTVLPTVKEQLINTGKAKLILREFPLDKFAMKASLLARCAPADKYYDLVEVIFRNQDRWVKSEDPINALKQLGALTGMDDAQMETCMNNVEMENAILKRVQDAQATYKVQSTPTFVFNDGAETFSGAQSPEKFSETVSTLSP